MSARETHDTDRLAELRAEIAERIAEVQRILGPERAPHLSPAAHIIARECSRGFNEAQKKGPTK